MVFPGRYSSGCKLCKRRKVKCDETRPSCRRCIAYGQPCPGYTDVFQFHYNRQDKEDPPPDPVTKPCTTALSPRHPPKHPARSTWSQNAVVVPAPHPPIDWSSEHMSLCYFVNRFVASRSHPMFPGFFSFVPDLYDGGHQNGLLELATLSVASMAAYNRLGDERLLRQSYKNYGASLKLLRRALAPTPDEDRLAVDDKTMGAVLLLGTFEDMNSSTPHPHLSGVHSPGLFYLLNKRGSKQFQTPRGLEFFLLAQIRLQFHSFMTDDFSYADLSHLSNPTEGVSNPLWHALLLAVKVPSLRRALKASPSGTNSDPRKEALRRQQAIAASLETLAQFDQWDSDALAFWEKELSDMTPPPRLGETASNPRHLDGHTAGTVVLCRTARILLSLGLVDYCEEMRRTGEGGDSTGESRSFLVSDQDPATNETTSTSSSPNLPDIETLSAKLHRDVGYSIIDLLYCVPYALGDIDRYGAYTPTGLRAWSKEELKSITSVPPPSFISPSSTASPPIISPSFSSTPLSYSSYSSTPPFPPSPSSFTTNTTTGNTPPTSSSPLSSFLLTTPPPTSSSSSDLAYPSPSPPPRAPSPSSFADFLPPGPGKGTVMDAAVAAASGGMLQMCDGANALLIFQSVKLVEKCPPGVATPEQVELSFRFLERMSSSIGIRATL